MVIEIFLHPGEWYCGDQDTRIRTTLGSCVAFTLWHPQRKIGAMCHYMLPGNAEPGLPLNARYANDALQLMMAELAKQRRPIDEYETKLFGGATMFRVSATDGANGLPRSVAQRNLLAAQQLVTHYGLRLVAQNLGGNDYRQLVFNLEDGDVWVRHGEYNSNASGGSSASTITRSNSASANSASTNQPNNGPSGKPMEIL